MNSSLEKLMRRAKETESNAASKRKGGQDNEQDGIGTSKKERSYAQMLRVTGNR